MAAPTPTARSAPTGLKLNDGFSSLITFARFPAVNFWEKAITPPGYDGGDEIDTSTMHNTTFRSKAPRGLIDVTETSATVAYDPAVYSTIKEMVNIRDTITVTFADGSTVAFFGFLKMFEPGEMVEGEQPEADITIVATNEDTDGAEQAPVVTSVAGT